jgi:hypothetical protein
MTIVVVDTSVLLNILDVPGRNQDRTRIMQQFRKLIDEARTELLLPLVAVVEAGNHIAQLRDGHVRRSRGERLAQLIDGALARKAPWVLVPFPEPDDLAKLTASLVDRLAEGVSFADASIIAIWEKQKTRWSKRRAYIWS